MKTILCVEDEQDLREILVEELVDAGYGVLQAAHGLEALACLDRAQPDLILCDIAMPRMDGYELLGRIRQTRPDLSNVPFVFLSAQNDAGQIVHGKHAGADDYLVKPINFDLMLATIAARLRQVQRIQAARGYSENVLRMFEFVSSGIVLLDGRGRVRFANPAALRLGAPDISPTLAGILDERGPAEILIGPPTVRKAMDAGISGEEYIDFMALPRQDGQRDLLVTVCALGHGGAGEQDAVAALFICGGSRDEPAPLRALESLFRLTPTEGRIAWAFAQGKRPDEIAAAFDISATTVAFHKRNIFQKTMTNRQADLIALLLTLPAPPETA